MVKRKMTSVTIWIQKRSIFVPMIRASGIVLLFLFASLLVTPFAILLEFHVHKAQIEKELCVQRDVVEAMRTCHGECQLSKRFQALEQESTAEFPVDRISVRLEPEVPIANEIRTILSGPTQRSFPIFSDELCEGHPVPSEHVPWSV